MRRRRVYFWAQGFLCSPSEVSRVLRLEPTSVWTAGQTVLSGGRVATTSAWQFESTLSDNRPLDEHVIEVLDKVEPSLEHLRSAVRPVECGMNCVAYFSGFQGNGFHLSAELISRLAALDLSVDFDLYGNDDSK